MSKAHLTALVSALLFLRWLATGHVALTVGGLTATVPALAVAAVAAVDGGRRCGGADRVPDPGRAGHARGLADTEGGHPMTAADCRHDENPSARYRPSGAPVRALGRRWPG